MHFLFDLDGVIIDSEGLYTRFWEETEREFPTGIPDFARAIKGTNLDSILAHFTEEERPQVLRRIHDFDRDLVYPLFEGAEELLQALQAEGCSMALVTSSNSEKMERLFGLYPQLRTYFGVIIDGGMVSRSKPDPEGYLLAAERLGVEPRECIVVEDSLQGIRAGRAAGATVWGLCTTLPREVIEPEAHRTFADIAEVGKQRS